MATPSEWDRLVNSKWPDNIPIPSDAEALAGAKRLYKRAMGFPYGGEWKITSGNRYTWPRYKTFHVNPNRRGAWAPPAGWPDIVHLMAHWCHRRKHPYDRPHSYKELDLEADLTRYAIAQGFHEGRLKRKTQPPKPKPSRKEVGHRAAIAGLARWEAKLKRAETAVQKYRKKVRYYEREAQNGRH